MRLKTSWPFRRRPGGLSTVFLIFGVFACLSSLTATMMGTPFSWLRARAARRLPQPTVNELDILTPGTDALFTGWLPEIDTPSPGSHGLVLYLVERAVEAEGTTTPGPSETWRVETPPPSEVTVYITQGRTVEVQLPEDVSLTNARTFEEQQDGITRRVRGYLPGQALTIEGTWEGRGLVTGRVLYAGSPDAYLAYLNRQTGILALGGAACGGIGLVLLAVAIGLRIIGR